MNKSDKEKVRKKIIGEDYVAFLLRMNFKNNYEESVTYIDSFSCSVCTRCETIVDMNEITTKDFHGCKRCLS